MTTHPMFERIQLETPGYAAAAIGSLDGREFMSHTVTGFDLGGVRTALVSLARSSGEVWEGLGGAMDFGSNDELLFSASRGFLLVRIDHPTGRFLAVMLESSGNIGYLRLNMRTWLRLLVRGA